MGNRENLRGNARGVKASRVGSSGREDKIRNCSLIIFFSPDSWHMTHREPCENLKTKHQTIFLLTGAGLRYSRARRINMRGSSFVTRSVYRDQHISSDIVFESFKKKITRGDNGRGNAAKIDRCLRKLGTYLTIFATYKDCFGKVSLL